MAVHNRDSSNFLVLSLLSTGCAVDRTTFELPNSLPLSPRTSFHPATMSDPQSDGAGRLTSSQFSASNGYRSSDFTANLSSRHRVFPNETVVLLEDRSTGNIEVHRQLLTERIAVVSDELVSLSRWLNASTWTCRLPLELLTEIFLLLQVEPTDYVWNGHDDDDDDENIVETEELSWLSVTHVCSHLRDAAIQYTPLWSNIPVALLGLVNTMITRSQGMNVRCPAYDGERQSTRLALAKVLAHSQRLRVVDLDFPIPRRDLQSSELFPSWDCSPPGAMLEELRLSSDIMDLTANIPMIVNAPLLRKLSLCSNSPSGIPMEKFSFGSEMTHLCLRSPSLDSQRQTRCTLVSLLRKMPRLERLHLVGQIPFVTPTHHWGPSIQSPCPFSGIFMSKIPNPSSLSSFAL